MESENQHTKRWVGVREIGLMAGPVILGAISFTVMQFVDVMFVSWLGFDNLAAIGSAGIWSYTLGVFFMGITGCVSTFVSQSLGRGRRENCGAYAWQGIYISMAAGSVVLVGWPLTDDLFGVMGHTPQVTELEVIYTRIRLLGCVFIAWQTALSSFFQGINRPVVPMYVAFIANFLNIGLDWLLIFPHGDILPGYGIAGAAWATVISLGLQALLLQYLFMRPVMEREYATRSQYHFDWIKAKDLFRIGWPSGVTHLLDVASFSLFTSFLVGRLGTVQLAAHTASLQFMHLIFIPAIGLNYAITPIVGQWIGRGEVDVAKSRTYTATRMAVIYMSSVGIILAIFGDPLMRIFSDDPVVVDLGHTLLIFAAVFAGFDAINIVMIGALRGAGDTRFMMIVMVVGSYFVSLPLAWVFSGPVGWGAKGAWFGLTLYVIMLSGVFFWRFWSEAWRGINIFSEDQPVDSLPPVGDVAPTVEAPSPPHP